MKIEYIDPKNPSFDKWMAEYEKNEKITADIQVGNKIFKNVKYKDFKKITSGCYVIDIRKFEYSNYKEFKFNGIWKKVFITFN